MKYKMNIAGLDRELPLCKVSDDLYIGAFIMFGDAEITVACARELLARAPKDYDYLLTAEAKSIPLIHEMARQSGAKKYFIARKGPKVYMPDPLHVEDQSITTAGVQKLYLGRDDADLIRGKRSTEKRIHYRMKKYIRIAVSKESFLIWNLNSSDYKFSSLN